jgi:hypothetical protein
MIDNYRVNAYLSIQQLDSKQHEVAVAAVSYFRYCESNSIR